MSTFRCNRDSETSPPSDDLKPRLEDDSTRRIRPTTEIIPFQLVEGQGDLHRIRPPRVQSSSPSLGSGVFAWSPSDIPGVDPYTHRLNMDPAVKPVQQRRRVYNSERLEAMKTEVQKLLSAGLIRELKYPTWLCNPARRMATGGCARISPT